MPRKAKAKSSVDVGTPKVSQTQKPRNSGTNRKLGTALASGQTPLEAIGGWTIDVIPSEGVGFSNLTRGTVTQAPAISPPNVSAGRSDIPAPRSAWMLFGSNDSFMSDDELCKPDWWNASPNIEIGDTLFFYFIAPRKAIHFIGRAISKPVLGASLRNDPDGAPQRWVKYDSMVRIDPIELTEIRTMFREARFLPFLKGAKYLRPDFANRLLAHARVAFSPSERCRKTALRPVTGKKELGEPNTISLAGLQGLQSTAFIYEEDVEYHMLEPLLRLAQVGDGVGVQRRYDLPGGTTADYAVLDGGRKALCIFEVKLHLGIRNDWKRHRGVLQARENAKECRAPVFVVMDCDRVLGFRTHDEAPCLMLDRKNLDDDALSALRAHILMGQTGAKSPHL